MSSPYLLDTCALIWLVDGSLRQDAADALDERYRSGELTYVSPFSAWEIGAKASRGTFRSPHPPHVWLQQATSLPGISLADLSAKVLLDSWALPGRISRDPADRIIAATAREYGFTVMTRDAQLLDYGRQGYLSVFEC